MPGVVMLLCVVNDLQNPRAFFLRSTPGGDWPTPIFGQLCWAIRSRSRPDGQRLSNVLSF